jgi:hypothetical protein
MREKKKEEGKKMSNIHKEKVQLVKDMLGLLSDKINGLITKEQFEDGVKTLSEIMRSIGETEGVRRYRCKECEDTGMVVATARSGQVVAVKCNCGHFEREAEKEKSKNTPKEERWWQK